ncbi:MAG: glycine radical domain-containing protein [Eubacteriales bacterium]
MLTYWLLKLRTCLQISWSGSKIPGAILASTLFCQCAGRLGNACGATPDGCLAEQLLRAFAAQGCFHWQFNIVDNSVLLAARKDPIYRSLVVRMAG